MARLISNINDSRARYSAPIEISGSLVVTGSITLVSGSVNATVTNASTASFTVSASFASTASFVRNAVSSSFASTASFFAGSVTSASFASTASFVNILNQTLLVTGSLSLKGNISIGNTTTSNTVLQRGQTPAGVYSTIIAAGTGISDTYPWSPADTDGASVELRAGAPASDQYSGGIVFTANGNTSPLGEGNAIIFKNRSGVNTYTERMRITYDGNVGINISPSAKLHIDGTVRIDNQNSSAPSGPNASGGTVTQYWGTADGTFLTTPNTWLKINLGGTDYYIPAYI